MEETKRSFLRMRICQAFFIKLIKLYILTFIHCYNYSKGNGILLRLDFESTDETVRCDYCKIRVAKE